ncbi:MAG: alpha-L-fucosidase [Candidatus Pacebacteria bacterium]|nr:alpha-L-fucosidase [Candidatus Paceibacterota bacterium]
MSTQPEWFRTHIRQVHMDFHMPEFPIEAIRNFNAEEFVGHLLHGKVNMIALFAKCHFGNSFYNTKVGHKHSGLENDFLREAAEECRKHGIKTIAYYSLCCDLRAYQTCPHWAATDAQGKPLPVTGPWGRVCINTPYREELALPQLEEIAADYPVDGFFIDIPFVPQCFCKYCRTKFQLMYGRELSEDLPRVERTAFIQNSCGRFLKELRAIANRHNPELKIVTNASCRHNSARTFSEQSDYGVWESQPHNNYLSHSFAARSVRTLDMPVQVMSVRFYQGWGDLTLKPAAQMTTEFAAMIGNGGVASSGDQVNVDGTLQTPVYDMFRGAFGFVEEREKLLFGAVSVPDTAVLAPVPRPDYPPEHVAGEAMLGAHKALVESHVQFDILSSLDLDRLGSYRFVVLTEPCDFGPDVFPALREWVAGGGTLVAVGDSVLGNRADVHLADVFGLEYLEPSVFSVSHFRPRPELRGETDDLPLQCRGRSYKVIPTTATVLADYIYPLIETSQTYAFRNVQCPPPSAKASPYPFTTVNTYGNGRAVYVAGSIFRIYWQTNHHWLRQFVEALWNHLDPNPLYRVDIPGVVETNLMTAASGDRLLNLIHYQVGHQGSAGAIPSVEKVHPLRDVACQVKAAGVQRVVLEPEGTRLAFEERDGYACFSVPCIKYLAIVRVVAAG